MRVSAYGLVTNFIHALLTNRNPDDPSATQFSAIITKASSPSTAHLFGLSLSQSSRVYGLTRSSSEHLDVAAIEEISKTLLKVIEVGAGDLGQSVVRFSAIPSLNVYHIGFANVLRARWMSLVSATVFQESPYMQARAFTVLGILMGNNLDSDFFYQILVALKRAIERSPDGDCVAVLSILRCMHKLIPGLVDHSSYLLDVFWVAVALLQTGHLPYYVEAMHVIRVVLEKLDEQGAFSANNVTSVLLQARSTLGDKMSFFDQVSGFTFTDEITFSVSMACLLYAVAQHQTLRQIAGNIIRAFLRIVSTSIQVGRHAGRSSHVLDPSLVGFFLASLPFCTTVATLRSLLEDANVDVPFWESNGMFSGVGHKGYKCAVPFSLLGVSDAASARLTIAFIVSMIELHVGDIPEREILYTLFAGAGDFYPAIVTESQCHYLVDSRYVRLLKFSIFLFSFPTLARNGSRIASDMDLGDMRQGQFWKQ